MNVPIDDTNADIPFIIVDGRVVESDLEKISNLSNKRTQTAFKLSGFSFLLYYFLFSSGLKSITKITTLRAPTI